MEFRGSEKQIKWAKDIVDGAKKIFEEEVKEAEANGGSGRNTIENIVILAEIVRDVFSNLASVWDAWDVIDNRARFEGSPVWGFMGIERVGKKTLKIGEARYTYTDLKDESVKKEFEEKVFEYLKLHKKIMGNICIEKR